MLALLEIAFPNIDPVAVDLGVFEVRWYGLSYLLSFMCAYLLLQRLRKGGYLKLTSDDIVSLLMYGIVGTFLGGRLGYLLFYSDFFYSGEFFENPLQTFGIENGKFSGVRGLSFHGGLLGVAVSCSIFCALRASRDWKLQVAEAEASEDKDGNAPRYIKVMWSKIAGVFDAGTLVAPIGIVLVRTANFINGELYGRIIRDAEGKPTEDASEAPITAMRFPTTQMPALDYGDPAQAASCELFQHLVMKLRLPPESAAQMIANRYGGPGGGNYELVKELVVNQGTEISEAQALITRFGGGIPDKPHAFTNAWEAAKEHIVLRHPSQLYQALCEGALVLLVVWLLRARMKTRGMIGGIFLIAYAAGRFPMEFFRQPDKQFSEGEMEGYGAKVLDALGVTQGQLLCVAMALIGLIVIFILSRARSPLLLRTPEELKLAGEPFEIPSKGD